MKRPGGWFRSVARRVCAPSTMERVIDPAIADLQSEHADAVRRGDFRRSAWIRLSGYVALSKTFAMLTARSSVRRTWQWAAADQYAIGRTLAYASLVIVLLTVGLALLPLYGVQRWRGSTADTPQLFLYVIPQAVPLAVVFGLPLGILIALRGRQATSRICRAVLAIGVVGAVATFIIAAWVLPEANQAFRALASGRTSVARGANELTLSELSARITALQNRGASTESVAFVLSYHLRLAVSFAPIAMTLFALALSIARRTTAASIGIVVIAAVVYFGYGALVIAGPSPRPYSWLPLAAVVWFPNVLFALLAALLVVRSNAAKICS